MKKRTAWLPLSARAADAPSAPSATLAGAEKRAESCEPSAKPATVPPARVVTTPAADTARSALLPVSATYTAKKPPLASAATPVGREKAAPAPVPSAYAATPPPASVVTAPLASEMARTALDSVSATKSEAPSGDTETPESPLNLAPVPNPSAAPAVEPPAIVVTTPAGVTRRTRLFPRSATYTCAPDGATASPHGARKAALVPVPSANAPAPEPASVITLPASVTARSRLLPVSAT